MNPDDQSLKDFETSLSADLTTTIQTFMYLLRSRGYEVSVESTEPAYVTFEVFNQNRDLISLGLSFTLDTIEVEVDSELDTETDFYGDVLWDFQFAFGHMKYFEIDSIEDDI